jgi:nicotinamidase-related amidase
MGYQITVLADACSAVDAGNAEVALRYLEHVVGARVESGVEARRT